MDYNKDIMKRANIYGADIGYAVQGAGEPLLLIHGTTIADALYPVFVDPIIADRYRIIIYHRRGYGVSSRACSPFTMSQEASDARALLRHLGIEKAHIAGYSYDTVKSFL